MSGGLKTLLTRLQARIKTKRVRPKTFSYQLEKDYYSRQWPEDAKSYLHLEPYLSSWLNPESVFRGKRILDIGAGECTYTRLIADRFGPKQIVACELFHERMLPAVQSNRNATLTFVAANCFRLPFRSRSFDVVFGSHILCQLPNLDDVIREVTRVLSINGCYVGIEPNPYYPAHLYRYFLGYHSRNQYLLRPKDLSAFRSGRFGMTIHYFYARLPRLRSRLVATCMGVIARKREA